MINELRFRRFPKAVCVAWCAVVATSSGLALGESRVWTSADGREIEGVFVRADEEVVMVRRVNLREVKIPLEMLSEADREFVSGKREEMGREAEETGEAKPGRALLSYQLPDGSEEWDPERKKRIADAMDAAVALYNQHGRFKKGLWANNSPGTPTADANYEGWINFGGTINKRVALHEISHTLGIGTHGNWQKNIKDGKWTGRHALEQLREFDGPDAELSADRMHFWPYGLNFDNESNSENDIRHVKMVAAMRRDMGIR